MLKEYIDRHAPLRHERGSHKRSPWITTQLQREMHKRDYLKQKTIREGNPQTWKQFKHVRNYTGLTILSKLPNVDIL